MRQRERGRRRGGRVFSAFLNRRRFCYCNFMRPDVENEPIWLLSQSPNTLSRQQKVPQSVTKGGAKVLDRRKMKWTKRKRHTEGETEGGNVEKELMRMERSEKRRRESECSFAFNNQILLQWPCNTLVGHLVKSLAHKPTFLSVKLSDKEHKEAERRR